MRYMKQALGADAVAWYEKNDLLKHKEEGVKMTTSCCPAFVMMAKKHFPTVYEKNVSKMVSPMEAMARYLKSNDEKLKVVFIGPCVAKKMEAMEDFSVVDYVLTFEELAAMLVTAVISILSRLKLMNVIVPAIMAVTLQSVEVSARQFCKRRRNAVMRQRLLQFMQMAVMNVRRICY